METPDVPPSETLRFRATLHTRWVDEDNQAVLNNAIYLTLMEEGRHAYFSELGLMEDGQFPFVLAAANMLFVAPGRGGAEVLLEMGTVHLGRSSFEQVYRVRDADSGDVWCEARHRLVAWDNTTKQKTQMTSEFRQKVAEFEGLTESA